MWRRAESELWLGSTCKAVLAGLQALTGVAAWPILSCAMQSRVEHRAWAAGAAAAAVHTAAAASCSGMGLQIQLPACILPHVHMQHAGMRAVSVLGYASWEESALGWTDVMMGMVQLPLDMGRWCDLAACRGRATTPVHGAHLRSAQYSPTLRRSLPTVSPQYCSMKLACKAAKAQTLEQACS